ncbi:hypothetical protein E5K00_00525 [Hymenobacter aquaticus]|uniref:DUF748 domain-containing protein n=1 Tax=Hymenobacter aquaticus TaxID=1867101 RepID=A0A4Z0Q4V3_9BACT|nr:hypothetical protein [Hymenobacter aquaticus]TGE23732.1 hypothetical protein E5K00_00525 [Hymenobacter aquaticus]
MTLLSSVPTTNEPLVLAGKKPRRWPYWVGGILLALLVVLGVALARLDPWLRRTLEKQVARQSEGRYQLRIGELHTQLLTGTVRLRDLRLRPAAADSCWQQTRLPRLLADVRELRLSGIGLWAALRGSVVPVDTVLLAGARLRVLRLPPPNPAAQPLHEQLPQHFDGLRIGYLGLRELQAAYGPGRVPQASVRQASFSAHDLLLSAAGAADSQRVGYAAAWAGGLRRGVMTVARHRVLVGAAQFASRRQQLTVDSLRVRSLDAMQRQGKVVRVHLVLPRLQVGGLRLTALRSRQLRPDSVVLTRPWLALALPTQPPPPLHEVLAPYLRQVQLGQLRVRGGTLHLTAIKPQPRIQDIRLLADNVLLTAAGAQDPSRIWYAKSWELRTGRVQTTVSAPVYWLGLRSIELLTRTGRVQATGIMLKPTMTPSALARYKGHQTPHITVRAHALQIAGFDFAAFARRRSLLAEQLRITKMRVLIAGDGRFALNPKASLVTQESLAKLAVRLNVRRVQLVNAYVATSYIGPTTGRPGYISFNRINVTLRNVTNDPRLMTAATPMTAQASGWLQNSWYATAAFRIPLLDPAGRHSGQGTFGPASITLLNTMTEPTRLVRFESGNVRRATVRFQGSRRQITGTMQAEYSDLKLTLLSKNGGPDQKTLLTKLGSKLLNGIVIRDENPRGLGPDKLKVGSMESRRDLRVSVFSLWRQGLVSGLLNSIGAPKKVARHISEQP